MFELIHTPKKRGEGHMLFKNEHGVVSLCDWSGHAPDYTDDGPLVVRPGTIATVSVYNSVQQ